MADPVAPPVQVQKKKGMGCWGCGCAIVLVVVVLIIVLGIIGGRMAYSMALGYTSPMAATLVTGDAGDAVYDSAREKVDAFGEAFENQQPATLTLTADEINTLITRDPAYDKLRGHLHVAMHDDVAVIDSSFLIGDLETQLGGKPSWFGDRYLNATTTTNVSIDPATHQLGFNITDLKTNGQQFPDSYRAAINADANIFLNAGLQKNQIAKDFLARVQKADIENGQLVIEIK